LLARGEAAAWLTALPVTAPVTRHSTHTRRFTRIDNTHALGVKPEHWDRIAAGEKDTEFRMYGSYRAEGAANELLLFRTQEHAVIPIAPLRVRVVDVLVMTTAQACVRFPADAALCQLSTLYRRHRRLHCICLAKENRTLMPNIVMLRPLNVYSVPQFSEGFIQFCLTEDLNKTVTVELLLAPSGFAAKRRLVLPPRL
jgi:hypothetical protein